MNEFPDWLETQHRLAEWGRKVNLLWSQDAQRVVNLFDQGFDSVIINGPRGSGKSMNLVPQMKQEVTRRGWHYAELDVNQILEVDKDKPAERKAVFEHELSRFPPVDSTSTGLMILDESGVLKTEEDISELFAESDRRGYKRSVMIPAGFSEEKRAKMITALQEVLTDQGKSSTVYKLERRTLPEELAREYFGIAKTPQEVIEFALPIFPMYPNVVYFIGIARSVESVKRWWKNYKDNFARFQRGLTREDVELIDQRLEELK